MLRPAWSLQVPCSATFPFSLALCHPIEEVFLGCQQELNTEEEICAHNEYP